MKGSTKLGAISAIVLFGASVASADIIFGPTDYSLTGYPGSGAPGTSLADITTLTSGQLGANDTLVIDYSVTRPDSISGGNFLTLTFNTTDGFYDFTSSGDASFMLRAYDAVVPGGHILRTGGSGAIADTAEAADFFASSPSEHNVRITVSGLSAGFTGSHSVIYEIDEFSTDFVSADKTMSGTLDFGGVDNGLNIDARALTHAYNIGEFTVTAIPEPSSLALLLAGLGAVLLARRRRR